MVRYGQKFNFRLEGHCLASHGGASWCRTVISRDGNFCPYRAWILLSSSDVKAQLSYPNTKVENKLNMGGISSALAVRYGQKFNFRLEGHCLASHGGASWCRTVISRDGNFCPYRAWILLSSSDVKAQLSYPNTKVENKLNMGGISSALETSVVFSSRHTIFSEYRVPVDVIWRLCLRLSRNKPENTRNYLV